MRRSDLHAILSLHSSGKVAGESVGNKGIGFRSVFAFVSEAEVWSRSREGAWWGIRLRHPCTLEPEVTDSWNELTVASFYAPELLEGAPPEATDDVVTVVRLPGIPAASASRVRDAIGELAARPLAFLERRARYRDGRLHVLIDDGTTETTKPVALEARYAHAERAGIAVPEAVRKRTGLELDRADVRVLLAPSAEGGDAMYWSYLPTERASGHGVHVHADFYLQSSRRDVAFRPVADTKPPDDPTGWNGWLLGEAARLVVDELWTGAAVLSREDFWRMASPASARCEHLKRAVASRVLDRQGRFRRLVQEGFAHPPEAGWTIQRYRDLFTAIEAWAHLAYSMGLKSSRGARLMDWRAHLLDETRASGAKVVPIVDRIGEEAASVVEVAVPLPAKGGRRIYLRRSEGFRMPEALARQGTVVTTFAPMPGRDPKELGLLEFERPEVLGHISPGDSDDEHAQLLDAIVRLATEQSSPGGVGSVLARGPFHDDPRPYWRFLVIEGPMAAAGRAMARVKVPVRGGGWEVASETVHPEGWPGAPVLDEERFAAIAENAWLSMRPFDMDAAASILGIGPVPVATHAGAPLIPSPPAGSGPALLHRWGAALGPLVAAFEQVRRALIEAPWLDDSLTATDLGGALSPGLIGSKPLRPIDVWWQDPRRGFRTSLLPVIERVQAPMPWMDALGICPIGTSVAEKVARTLEQLRTRPELLASRPADVEGVYVALITSLPDSEANPSLPVLVRRVAKDGRARELTWRQPQEDVWYDSGKATHALAAFGDYSLWVVRRDAAHLASALGLIGFQPGGPVARTEGAQDDRLRDAFASALWRALPDLFAAASQAPIHPRFDGDAALVRAAVLEVKHAPRAWLEYSFAGRTGTLGLDEGDDVFRVTEHEGSAGSLVFDGSGLPLVAAAGPLSELLCGNRSFVHVFTAGLVAWAGGAEDVEPVSVRRFRREHGLSDSELARWRERLAATRMHPARRSAWRMAVADRLGAYGAVEPDRVDVDRPVTPDAWRMVTDTHATETDIERKLCDLDPAPRVLFAPGHRRAFLAVDRLPLIAEAAELRDTATWTEALYQQLRAISEKEPDPTEEALFRTIRCDVIALWRRRLGLGSSTVPPASAALAFARGQIPLRSFPNPEPVAGALLEWDAGTTSAGLAPLADEEWLRKARRQATGGARAEDAVLLRAEEDALAWRSEDHQGFALALREAWREYLGAKGLRDVLETAIAGGKIAPALHASKLVGNAGYDLLVPDRTSERFLKVEIKRVEGVEGPAFFLSENERRRALAIGEPWRLWVVAGDGQARDVTWIKDTLESAEPPVAEVLALGLRPGEWLVKVR